MIPFRSPQGWHRPLSLSGLALAILSLVAAAHFASPAASETVPELTTFLLSPANTVARRIQSADAEPVVHPIKVIVVAGEVYLLDGGRLLRGTLGTRDSSEPLMAEPIMPPQQRVDGVYVHELVDMAQRSEREIVVLDKLGSIFSYDRDLPRDQAWKVVKAVDPSAPEPYPLFLALETYEGTLYILDSALGQVWRHPGGPDRPPQFFPSGSIDARRAIDIAIDGRVYLLLPSGAIKTFVSGLAGDLPTLNAPDPAGDSSLPLAPRSIRTRRTWPYLYVVDPPGRRVLAVHKDQWLYTQQFVHVDPAVWGDLRDAWIDGGTMWVLAGTTLFTSPVP